MKDVKTNTKAVACRLPFDNYLELVSEASEKGMSMSDLLIVKLFSHQDKESTKFKDEPDHHLVEISGHTHLSGFTKASLQEALIEAWDREKRKDKQINELNKKIIELEKILKIKGLTERLESLEVPKKTRNKSGNID